MKQPLYVHRKWLAVLLVVEIIYVLSEFAFNAALLNAASGLVRDDQALHDIEVFGRILSGVGLSILLYWVFFRKKLIEENVSNGLKAFAKSLAICIPAMYFGQKIVVDALLVNGTNGAQRQYAEMLILMKTGLQNGIVKMNNLELSKGNDNPGEMAFVSVMGAILLGVPEYANVLANNEEAIARRVNELTSQETADKAFPSYHAASEKVIESYKKYAEASQEYSKRSRDKINTSTLWSRVDRQTRDGYSKYRQASSYYSGMDKERFEQKFGFPKGIKSLTEFRRNYATVELINMELINAGVVLNPKWNGEKSTFSSNLIETGGNAWNKAMSNNGLKGILPGLSFREFEQSATIQGKLKAMMGDLYIRGMRIGLSKNDFLTNVVMPHNEAAIQSWIKKAKTRSKDLEDGGSREEEGRQFVRALIVPPIALILSLFFSLLTLAKLPIRAISFVDLYKGDVPWVSKARKFIMAGDLVAILSLPLARSDTKIMNTKIFQMMAKKAKDTIPFGNYGVIWLIKGEPVIYKTGQSILESVNLDQRDVKN